MKAQKIFHEKIETPEGVIVEMKVWKVNRNTEYPEGFKYSFFAVQNGVVLVGYDNHKPKGHHRHLGKHEEIYEFQNLTKLKNDFTNDLNQLLKNLTNKGK